VLHVTEIHHDDTKKSFAILRVFVSLWLTLFNGHRGTELRRKA